VLPMLLLYSLLPLLPLLLRRLPHQLRGLQRRGGWRRCLCWESRPAAGRCGVRVARVGRGALRRGRWCDGRPLYWRPGPAKERGRSLDRKGWTSVGEHVVSRRTGKDSVNHALSFVCVCVCVCLRQQESRQVKGMAGGAKDYS
jgi:hypothetical protein